LFFLVVVFKIRLLSLSVEKVYYSIRDVGSVKENCRLPVPSFTWESLEQWAYK